MNTNLEPNDERLRRLLRSSRPAPALPPRFQEGVWRRIGSGEVPATGTPAAFTWLEQWVERLLLPRFALAGLSLLLAAGALTGALAGAEVAKQQAQQRYWSAVAPSTLP